MAQKIGNTAETQSTIRVDLNKYLPGCNLKLAIFVYDAANGKAKGRQTTLNEFLQSPSTNQ
jgi:hypothetical protein